jgi:hypothetical protein
MTPTQVRRWTIAGLVWAAAAALTIAVPVLRHHYLASVGDALSWLAA